MSPRLSLSLLTAAVTATLSPAVDALAIDPNGVGQVLIFPYYTVNAGQATLLSVTNTTADVKAVKVRVREGTNGASVADFNVYIAAHGTFSASITPEGSGARMDTDDPHCTVPDIRTTGRPFTNYTYTGANRDHPGNLGATLSSLTRAREGYVEMVDMGSLQIGTSATQLAEEATIGANDLPANCQALVLAWTPPTGAWHLSPSADMTAPGGGLHGSAAVIDVAAGSMFSYTATALTRFYTGEVPAGGLHSSPGSAEPTLASANNGAGQVIVEMPPIGTAPATNEALPVGVSPDAVSLLFMRYSLFNDFFVEPALAAATEWVVTLPTKGAAAGGVAAPRAPFVNAFADDGEGCHMIDVSLRLRDGRSLYDPTGIACFPEPPPTQDVYPAVCFATNVIAFDQTGDGQQPTPSAILGSTGAITLYVDSVGLPVPVRANAGVGTITFAPPEPGPCDPPPTPPLPRYRFSVNGHAYEGLPVLGFSVQRATNADAQPGRLAVYGGAFPHHFVRRLEEQTP
jgi:hypothetical protein